MYKNIMIVCSGEDFTDEKMLNYSKISDLVIAVDGGLNILDKLAIIPGYFLGDMDSVDEEIKKKYDKIEKDIYPVVKDFTDSELALKKAISYNPDNIFLFAATGSYFDHSIANILNIIRNNSYNTKIITSNSEIFFINKKYTFSNLKNRRFSIFPLTDINGLIMKGCKYSFKKDAFLSVLDYSVSNVIDSDIAIIEFEKGMMYCVLFDEGFK